MSASGTLRERPPERIAVGDALALERWDVGDAASLLEAVSASAEHLRPWMTWADGYDAARAAQFLTDCAREWARGESFAYALRDRDGRLLGSGRLMDRIGDGGLEIGYWLHVEHTGRGLATRAAAALTAEALELARVTHLEIHHDEANLASRGVPERLGFRCIGVWHEPAQAPSDSGREVRWRMNAADFARSPCASLLASSSGAPR